MQLIPLTGTITFIGIGHIADLVFRMQLIPLTGTITRRQGMTACCTTDRMQLIPLTGTITLSASVSCTDGLKDATHTPHGDDNYINFSTNNTIMMQLIPLTGTITIFKLFKELHPFRCNSYPSRGR